MFRLRRRSSGESLFETSTDVLSASRLVHFAAKLTYLVRKRSGNAKRVRRNSTNNKIIVTFSGYACFGLCFSRPSTTGQGLSCWGCPRGGPYTVVVDGLKDGLKELGLAEGKHYVLEIRNLKGDRKAAEEAASSLERGKVDLICACSDIGHHCSETGDVGSSHRVRYRR